MGRITDLKSRLAQTAKGGIVVYAVVPLERGTSVLRFESAGSNKAPIEEIISRSELEDAALRRAVTASARVVVITTDPSYETS